MGVVVLLAPLYHRFYSYNASIILIIFHLTCCEKKIKENKNPNENKFLNLKIRLRNKKFTQTRSLTPLASCLLFAPVVVFFVPTIFRPLTRSRATPRWKISVNTTHFSQIVVLRKLFSILRYKYVENLYHNIIHI